MNKKKSITRRDFVGKAAGTLGTALLLNQWSFANSLQQKLRHACIGVGGMGAYDLGQFSSHPDIIITALCDTDANALKAASEKFPQARTYTDWRELLQKEQNNIDSLNVSVPDHNHFIVAWNAIQLSKHVYCQKPMCHDVAEVRFLTNAAEKAKVVTQLGTQHAAGKGDRTGVQWIKEKKIGKIKNVYLCSNRSGIAAYRPEGPRPQTADPVPETLNWDIWTGTAPERPFAKTVYHPGLWRSRQDFGTGWSGDIGCHIFDAVWKGLSLNAPVSVQAKVQESWKNNPKRRKEMWPQSNHITWIFPGNEYTAGNHLQVEWFDGEFYPPKEVQALYNKPYPEEAAILVGTEGALLIPHAEMAVLLPQEKFNNVPLPELKELNHYHQFVDACLTNNQTASPFRVSGPMTEAILLGTVAIRVPDTVLNWDAKKLRFTNNSSANNLLKRKYRKGWETKAFS